MTGGVGMDDGALCVTGGVDMDDGALCVTGGVGMEDVALCVTGGVDMDDGALCVTGGVGTGTFAGDAAKNSFTSADAGDNPVVGVPFLATVSHNCSKKPVIFISKAFKNCESSCILCNIQSFFMSFNGKTGNKAIKIIKRREK